MGQSTTHTFAVTGMHCASCTMLIDETVEDLPGVHTASTNLRAARTTVQLDPQQITPAQVIAAIGEAGYAATVAA